MSEQYWHGLEAPRMITGKELRIVAWIIEALYNGRSWRSMLAQHPEISDVAEKLPEPEWDDA